MVNKLLDKISLKANAQRTLKEDPLQKFNFRMIIPGIPTTVGFQKVSGLDESIEAIEYAEGGYEYSHKLPGRLKVGEVTCERGTYSDVDFQEILRESVTKDDMRKTIIIEQYNRFGEVGRTWKLAEAWVSKWEGSDLDATSDDVAIEKITIQFERYL